MAEIGAMVREFLTKQEETEGQCQQQLGIRGNDETIHPDSVEFSTTKKNLDDEDEDEVEGKETHEEDAKCCCFGYSWMSNQP